MAGTFTLLFSLAAVGGEIPSVGFTSEEPPPTAINESTTTSGEVTSGNLNDEAPVPAMSIVHWIVDLIV
jgi:hypothetical protein